MITFDDVSFAYQGGIPDGSEPPALRHIHFHAERGECIVLCGKSGCGKTTMLRMVNGLVPHFYQGRLEGDITVGNVHVKEASLPQVAAVAGSVFQNPRTQFFHLDTTGEMAFNMENLNIPHEKNGGTLKGNCLEAGYTDFDGQRYFSIIRWGKAANCMWFRVCLHA